jgi:hypothetical protein
MRQKVWSARDLDAAGDTGADRMQELLDEIANNGGEGSGGGGTCQVGIPPWFEAMIGHPSDALAFGGEGEEPIGASDIRMKDNIEPIGRTAHDLPLYSFRYKGGNERYSGVMAQDVLNVMPEAVSVGDDGFYRVNYAMLGIRMKRLS